MRRRSSSRSKRPGCGPWARDRLGLLRLPSTSWRRKTSWPSSTRSRSPQPARRPRAPYMKKVAISIDHGPQASSIAVRTAPPVTPEREETDLLTKGAPAGRSFVVCGPVDTCFGTGPARLEDRTHIGAALCSDKMSQTRGLVPSCPAPRRIQSCLIRPGARPPRPVGINWQTGRQYRP